MLEERFSAGGFSARLCRCNTAVVGTGAAGYNAADRLWQLGQRDILIVTENRLAGTSRNTGSDKQTYYKLTLSGPRATVCGKWLKRCSQGSVWTAISLCARLRFLPRAF